MNTDLTEIVVVLDRSGSMLSCRADAEGGLNAFIIDQKKQPGDAVLTLVQFDHEYEFVIDGKRLEDVQPTQKLEPRGATALLDAVGRSILETTERLNKLPSDNYPGLVVFVIITDGQENASKEFTLEKVKKLITDKQEKDRWKFTFLGADKDAFTAGVGLGIPASSVAKYDTRSTSHVFAAASSTISVSRAAAAAGNAVDLVYSDAQRKLMGGE